MMPMLMHGFQLRKDRGNGRIGLHLGSVQFGFKGFLLLMQSLPLIFGGDTLALALESLELLLQVVMLRFEARIGGESLLWAFSSAFRTES